MLVWLKLELFVPVTLMPVIVNAAFPVFTSRIDFAVLVVPTACPAKPAWFGAAVRNGPFTPVPVTAIASGLILVLSVIVIAPDTARRGGSEFYGNRAMASGHKNGTAVIGLAEIRGRRDARDIETDIAGITQNDRLGCTSHSHSLKTEIEGRWR